MDSPATPRAWPPTRHPEGLCVVAASAGSVRDMDDRGALREFRLRRPPVTQVRLTLFFVKRDELRLTGITGLIDEFSRVYPNVEERLPLLGWEEESQSEAMVELSMSLPQVEMTSENGDRSLEFQADRFSLSWRFHEGASYPGFEVLHAEIAARFGQFTTHVTKAFGGAIHVRRAGCFYSNDISEIPGPALAAFLLTGSEAVSSASLLNQRTYVGARVSETVGNCAVEVGLDASSDEISTYWLRSTSDAISETTDLLEEAHGTLIERFVGLTPAWLVQEWDRPEEET